MQNLWQIHVSSWKNPCQKLEKCRPHINLVSKGREWVSDWHGFTMIGPESDKNWNIRNCNVADKLFSAIYLGVREKIKTWTMFIYVSGCGSISVLRTCQSKDLVWSLYLSTIRTSVSNKSQIKDDKDASSVYLLQRVGGSNGHVEPFCARRPEKRRHLNVPPNF